MIFFSNFDFYIYNDLHKDKKVTLDEMMYACSPTTGLHYEGWFCIKAANI